MEERSESESNKFWARLLENNPELTGKILGSTIEYYIADYCFENLIYDKEFKRYFWNNSKYPKKKIRIGDKTYYGVNIDKTLEQ